MSEVPVTTPLMSQRAYAKRCGLTPMAVCDGIKSGRLRLSVKLDEFGIAKIADPVLADKEWVENGNYARAPHLAPASVRAADPDSGTDAVTMGEASTRDKHWKAKLSELKYKEAVGELIQASEVRREWTETLSQCRTKLLALPSQVRQAIPSLTLDDVVIVENLVRQALEDLVASDG